MKNIIFALLLGVMTSGAAQAATCATGEPFPFKTQYAIEQCPEDIQGWMNRANACAHFAGEEATDAARKKFIDEALAENKCEKLWCDFHETFAKYEGDIVYTGVMFEYVRAVYGSDENIPECVAGEKK